MSVFLFTDIEGSTKKWESFREAMAKALALHDEILLSTIKTFNGTIIKNTGDGFFAMFNNKSAIQCAVSIQQQMGKADWSAVGGIKVRIAIHAGDAEKRGDDYFGPVINRTARILATGWGGQVLLTPDVLNVSDLPVEGVTVLLGNHLLKDLSDPQTILELTHPSLPIKDFPPIKSLSSRPNNLYSQSTPFFGREAELTKISAMLKDPACRLLTMVGQGGVGKTRLAFQAAAERLDDFADGVYFVPLAPVSSPDTMASAIASAVHFSFSGESEMAKELLRFFKERHVLLVLDNFEHLLPAASYVSEMLKSSPGLKIIVSSRTRLNLSEEWVVELEGLPYPESQTEDPLESFGAVKFFANCAQRVHEKFTLKSEDAKEVARICQLVSGVPLGIELAAAWVRALSCKEVREEIEKNIDFLASNRQGLPERQQSLRAVFEYSWNLLSEEEKRAIRGMSLFRGGFLRDQAEKVVGCSILLLSALVDKSLLRKSLSGRFEMHEMLRQFCLSKLKELPEEYDLARSKHGNYFCDFLSRRESGLKGRNEDISLLEISREISNVHIAWEWAVESRDIQAMDMACNALYQYYEIKFLAQEGEEAFALAAAKLSELGRSITPEQSLIFAKVTARQGWFCYLQGRMDQAEYFMRQGLDIATNLKADEEIGQCLQFLCALYRSQGKFDEQENCAKQSLDIYKRLKNEWGTAWALYHLAQKPKQMGHNDQARKYFLESLEYFRKLEYVDGVAWTLFGLGQISVAQKDYEAAKKYFGESIIIFDGHSNKVSAGWTLIDMVRMYASLDEYEVAFNLATKAYEAFNEGGYPQGLAWSQYYRSESAYNLHHWEEALQTGRDALRLFVETENLLGQAWVYTNLCRTANDNGQYEEGQVYGKKGVETFSKIGDQEGAGACQNNLAMSELGLKNYPAAERTLLRAIENGIIVNIPWRILETILGLAKARNAANKLEEALCFSSLVAQHPESLHHLKAEASKMTSELLTKVEETKGKKIKDSVKSIQLDSFAKQLVDEYQIQIKSNTNRG